MDKKLTYIQREIESLIKKWLFKNKILIILGPRQVGKTTVMKKIISDNADSIYLNCELLTVKTVIESLDPYSIKRLIGEKKLAIFDESQQIKNIGLALKLLHDTFPELQIIATGSSSFELKNKVNEPLTGRALDFLMLPISLKELLNIFNRIELTSYMEKILRFGQYPEIINSDYEYSKILLDNLASRYLYKDILEFESLKKPDLLLKLLQLLAFQIGSEVSMNEISNKLGITRKTVERYIDLLEKCYVIFRLKSFSRNFRKVITKKVKIYFYDIGIRNSIIAHYNPLSLRNDIGQLWENFCIAELMKKSLYEGKRKNFYFWRSRAGQEIDFLEEYEGKFNAYEMKWKDEKKKIPDDFLKSYGETEFKTINSHNFFDYLL